LHVCALYFAARPPQNRLFSGNDLVIVNLIALPAGSVALTTVLAICRGNQSLATIPRAACILAVTVLSTPAVTAGFRWKRFWFVGKSCARDPVADAKVHFPFEIRQG
jgi:hypothetical protein